MMCSCLKGCTTLAEMEKEHGTPDEFDAAVARAAAEFTVGEADAAVERYRREWNAMQRYEQRRAKLRTVWIQHHPGEPDSATARPANVLTPEWWVDAFRGGGTVTEIEYDPNQLTATVRRHYADDGSHVGSTKGEHCILGVTGKPR